MPYLKKTINEEDFQPMRNVTQQEFEQEYCIIKDLSPDKNEKTYLAMRELSDGMPFTVVLKETSQKIANIYEALGQMWNPYIADTYDVLTVTDNTEVRYIAVTEYVYAENSPEKECVSLFEFIEQNGILSEKTALSVCVQISKGLSEFHRKGFVHRDLKPENIMISKYDLQNPEVKIIDFGGAKHLNFYNSADLTVIGTLGYQVPETLSSRTTHHADIYSIGCILNFMLTAKEPSITVYKNNFHITRIIETATNEDPSHRYADVNAMQKELEHTLKTHWIDKIPILNTLPGFRTHTIWKEIISAYCYIWIIYMIVFSVSEFDFYGIAEVFIFYVTIPLILLFDMGYLLRFFPKTIRQNNRLFLNVRVFLLFVTIFAPLVIHAVTGGYV